MTIASLVEDLKTRLRAGFKILPRSKGLALSMGKKWDQVREIIGLIWGPSTRPGLGAPDFGANKRNTSN
jgi:hypothetical protein